MKYFNGCKTIEDVKKVFKEYARKLHPDNGGDEEAFKIMMQEYNEAFKRLKNVHANMNGETYESEKESQETPEQFAKIINKLIFMQGVKIEIIGSWIWLSGNTMTYKDDIKAAGFWWSKSKKAWYYTGETDHKKRRGHYSMNGLRERWGSVEVEKGSQKAISA